MLELIETEHLNAQGWRVIIVVVQVVAVKVSVAAMEVAQDKQKTG
jgi:anti-sigma-K factor RskA